MKAVIKQKKTSVSIENKTVLSIEQRFLLPGMHTNSIKFNIIENIENLS